MKYSNRDDILRVVIGETDEWVKQDKPKRAVDLIRSALRTASNAQAAPLLRKMKEDLAAPIAGPPAKKQCGPCL